MVASRRGDIEFVRTFSDGAGAKRRTASDGGGLARRRAGATAGGGDRDGGLVGLCAHRVVRAGGSETTTTTGVTRNEVGVTSTGCFALFLYGAYNRTRAHTYNQSRGIVAFGEASDDENATTSIDDGLVNETG